MQRWRTESNRLGRYHELLQLVHKLELSCGFCYTQFADTFQEANGLLRADRTPKFPLQSIRQATRGPASDPGSTEEAPESGQDSP